VDAITTTLSELNFNHLSYIKVMVEFCNDVLLIDSSVSLVKRLFEALYNNKLPSYIEPLSEWRRYYISVCTNVSEKVLVTIPDFAPYVFVLMLHTTKEALNNTIETLYICIKLLRYILINFPSKISNFIYPEHQNLYEIISKLLHSYSDKLLTEEKLFSSFISEIYPQISPYLTTDKRKHLISTFELNLLQTSTPSKDLLELLSFIKDH